LECSFPTEIKSHLSANVINDSEYAIKVEKIKLEHHNVRTKALKYFNFVEMSSGEERRPSRFHLKCPICLEYCKNSFELSD